MKLLSRIRSLLALPVLICAASGPAAAADPELTPAEVLKLYESLGLPLAPKTAKLVRFEFPREETDGQPKPPEYWLVFEIKPGTKTKGPVFFLYLSEQSWFEDTPTREVKPDRAALKDITLDSHDAVMLAAQCQARGWTELAQECLKQYPKDDEQTPRQMLISGSQTYWRNRTTHPTIDRAPVAKKIKELIGKYPEWNTEDNRALLKSLELALVPSKAKPGSIEALIDALVDYHVDEDTNPFDFNNAYWQLADRGFDAVPALLAHLDDDRLTRAMGPGWQGLLINHLRVRNLARGIIARLATEQLAGIGDAEHERFKRVATEWWEKAQKQGEETYLLEHVLPPKQTAPEDGQRHQINFLLLRVIAVKYPKQVPALYRTVLDKRPDVGSWDLVEVLGEGSLTAKEKLDLFVIGAEHKDYGHRLPALREIKKLDQKRFDALLLTAIENLPLDVRGDYRWCSEAKVAGLAIESDEPRVWPALEQAAKRASLGLRMELLDQFGDTFGLQHRTERLRLLAAFLDDATIRDRKADERIGSSWAGSEYERIEVRDFATLKIAELLEIKVKVKKDRTAAEWAMLREKVREALKRELDKKK